MQYTIFKCDKCGQEWRTDSKDCPQQVCLELKLTFGSNTPDKTGFGASLARYTAWCRPCVLAAGVSERYFDPPPSPKPAVIPTTEDVLVDFLERLGFTRDPNIN